MILNGKEDIDMDMAVTLSEVFGSTPETWLSHQKAYDLWKSLVVLRRY